MNGINTLFVISCIFIPLLLISINYDSISDFYSYSVPLNNLVIDLYSFSDDPDAFQKTLEKNYSSCFTTDSGNFFCYEKPRIYENSAVSYIRSSSGIQGELHFDPIDVGVSYFTMKNMTLISEDTALVTFADKNYRVGNKDRTNEITEKFEFSVVIKKFDTFIAKCDDYEGTSVTVVQYLGIITLEDVDYFATWHTPANSENGIKCSYPEIIQYSLEHNFREL